MLRRFLFLIAVLVIFFPGLPAQAGKDKQIVFGPVYCEIDGDGVHFSVHELDMDRRGKGVIVITNNTPQMKIKDGFIRLDKKLKYHKKHKDSKKQKKKGSISLTKYLRGHKNKSLEKKIDFKDAKYLTVYLKGAPKASITVEIRGKGHVPSQNEPPVADGQAISTAEDTAVATTLTATDVDGDSLTYAVTALPDHGTLSGAPPALIYTPDENYHGDDSFSFRASDGNLTGNTAIVSLSIDSVNDTPMADAGSDQEVVVMETVTLEGSGSTDVDGDNLTYEWAFVSRPTASSTSISYLEPGTATFLADIPGSYEVELLVYDGTVKSASDSVVITADYAPFSARETKMTAGDAEAGGGFGTAVAIDGDTAIAGTGSAYIYKYDGSVWTEQAKLTAIDEQTDDHFGAAVSISSDTALVGAYGNDDDGADSGAAYIFTFDDEAWTEQAKLTAGDATAGDNFGVAVAISENRALVGAAGDDDSGDKSGSAYIFSFGDNGWSQQAKLTANEAEANDGFGVSTAMSADGVMVGAAGDDDMGADAGAAYFFKLENFVWQQQNKLIADDGAPGDGFGTSLAVSGSYAIVGAAGADVGGEDAGAAYIFAYEGFAWTQVAKLSASDAQPLDRFGAAVAISGNYAAVGAPGSDDGGQGAGAVYIFKYDGSTWNEIANLTAEAAHAGDHFGGAVAIEGANVFAGAAGDDDGGDDSGAAYIFAIQSYHSVNLTADPAIIGPGASATLSWTSVNAATANLDQDIGEVPVSGSITVMPVETTTYTLTATGPYGTVTDSVTVTVNTPPEVSIIQPDGIDDTADAGFTIQWVDADSDDDATVSLYYDTDNSGADGILIVGGLSENADQAGEDEYAWDTSSVAEGVYYVYAVIDDGVTDPVVDYSGGRVSISHNTTSFPDIKLTASDAAAYDYFGESVCINGDYAIVGATGDDDRGSGSGSVYIFKRQGSSWAQVAKLTAGDGEKYETFGSAVSLSGDYAIVGARNDNDGGSDSGSAYVFKRQVLPGGTEQWLEHAKLTAGDAAASDHFGYSVSISGDYAIVGADDDDDNGTDSGSAYIFRREVLPDGTEKWGEQAKFTAIDGAASDYFGTSVSISGAYAIVSAHGDDDHGSWSGSAYIFERVDSSWSQRAKLTANDAARGDYFAKSVSISGKYAIVSAGNADGVGQNSGAAYIFKREESDWTQMAKLIASDTTAYDDFGYSVSISDNYAIVGAKGDDDGGNSSGSVYIFKREGSIWIEQAKHTASDAVENEFLGDAVSISNGYAIAGIKYKDGVGDDSGAAYIYSIACPTCPAANINAANEQIVYGDSTTLSWSFLNATSVTIDNGIGVFSENGSISVTPTETTTYTITATGPWGTITDSVTVYILPTLQISASAATIIEGESATLSWSSSRANACEISPDIGTVALNGSTAVSPTETTTYTITASGAGGQTTATVTITVIPLIALEINSPNTWLIYRPDVMVQGTFTHATGNETGITVNGIPALVYGGQFVANHVPLTEREYNTITVTATDNQGYTATAEITVYAWITDGYIRITADTQSGVSPFETELKVEGTFSFDQEPTISVNGPGEVDHLNSLGDARYNIGITTPGIYYITAEATDEEARVYTDTVALVVMDLAAMDAMLQEKWNGMRQALIGGNFENAVSFIKSNRRAAYDEVFRAIPTDQIINLIPDADNIELVDILDGKARYVADIDILVNGQPTTISSYIIFVYDTDGVWKIKFF